MGGKLRYIVAAAVILCSTSAMAQEIISDELIYDRVSGYMQQAEEYDIKSKQQSKNIQEIRYKHDIRLSYGAPGLFSEFLLGNISVVCDCALYHNYPYTIEHVRHNMGPMRKLSTLNLEYSYCIRPGFWLGARGTFAGIWMYEYDTVTSERLYDNNIYNIGAMVEAKLCWLRRDKLEMYSSLSLGLAAHIERANGGLTPMFDAVFVGLSLGRKFYGFVEVGAGIGGSARGGIGIRFNGKK